MGEGAVFALLVIVSVAFPAVVVWSESRGGRYRPRMRNGRFMSRRAGYLRFVPVLAVWWLLFLVLAFGK